MVEVEKVLNARIKNYVYDDEQSISYPPTPSHTINGRRIASLPNSEHFQIIRTNNILTKRARHQKKLFRQFTCTQWQKEYLLILRENGIVKSRKSNNENISVGDIVIVKCDSTGNCLKSRSCFLERTDKFALQESRLRIPRETYQYPASNTTFNSVGSLLTLFTNSVAFVEKPGLQVY